MASVLALLINNNLPKSADRIIVPFIEESLKNGLAFIFSVSPLPVHLIFGLAEGVFEGIAGSSIWLFGNALVGHGIYGAVAMLLWRRPLLASLVSFILHALYNIGVVELLKKSR